MVNLDAQPVVDVKNDGIVPMDGRSTWDVGGLPREEPGVDMDLAAVHRCVLSVLGGGYAAYRMLGSKGMRACTGACWRNERSRLKAV